MWRAAQTWGGQCQHMLVTCWPFRAAARAASNITVVYADNIPHATASPHCVTWPECVGSLFDVNTQPQQSVTCLIPCTELVPHS